MQPTLFTTLALAALALPGLGQDAPPRVPHGAAEPARTRAPLPGPAAALQPLTANRDVVHYDEPGDGSIWARGADFKASFDGAGASFVPFLGSDAPRNYPLHFAPVKVRAAGTPLTLEPCSAPTRGGARVSFARGDVVEVYELTPGGMEQLFVFPTPTPAGPLVLSIGVDSELVCEPLGDGLRFRNERGGVDYGAATVLDAAGRAAAAPLEWTGDAIEIRVPASFLAQAQWPVVVDPLVSTFTVDDYFLGLLLPDAAYDLTSDTFAIVYEEYFSDSDFDIYHRRVDASTGALVGEGYISFASTRWTQPRIASNNFSDQHLIVATEEQGPGYTTVVYRVMDAATGTLGPLQGIDGTEFVSQFDPDVGGDFYLGSSYWCVVWTEQMSDGQTDPKYRLVNLDGIALGASGALLTNDAEPAARTSISNSAGTDISGVTHWTVVWEAGAVGSRYIRGAQISWSGFVVAPSFPVSLPGSDAREPSVSTILDSGDREFLVVYSEPGPTAREIHGDVFAGATPVRRVNLTRASGGPTDLPSRAASVDSDGQRFIVGHAELQTAGGIDEEVYLSTFTLLGSNLCPSEPRVRVSFSSLVDTQMEVASEFSGGGGPRRVLAPWSSGTSHFDANVLAALYDASLEDCLGEPFCTYPVPNSTNEGGHLRATGSPLAGGNPLLLSATSLPANQFGYFLGSQGWAPAGVIPPGSQGRLCLSGTIARFNQSGQVGFSGPSGEFALDVDTLNIPLSPVVAILAGQVWHFQAWFRDFDPGPTSNFTNAVRIVFE